MFFESFCMLPAKKPTVHRCFLIGFLCEMVQLPYNMLLDPECLCHWAPYHPVPQCAGVGPSVSQAAGGEMGSGVRSGVG